MEALIPFLRNPVYDEDFFENLKKANELLSADNAQDYFDALMVHFQQEECNLENATTILNTILQDIQNDDIFEVFKEQSFYQLPFGQFPKPIFDIIYDVLQKDPSVLCEDDFGKPEQFQAAVRSDPRKGLSVIAMLSQKYIEDQELYAWPVVDVLLNKDIASTLYTDPQLLSSSLSILVFLVQKSQEYAEARLTQIFKHIDRNILTENHDDKSLRQIYVALCYLRDEAKKIGKVNSILLPFEKMCRDLDSQKAQGPILALLVDNNNPEDLKYPELIQKLFEVAQHNLKASIVLMKLATSKSCATYVFGDGEWLLKKLPDTVDTLRLFLVIFKHQFIRVQCANNKNFIPFLKLIIEQLNSAGVVTIVCTIIRRIELDEQYVKNLGKQGLVKAFIQSATQNDDDTKVASHSLLLFLNTIAEYAYLDDYLSIIPFIVDKTTHDKNLSEIASYIDVTLAKYQECLDKMIELNLDKFFRKQVSNPNSPKMQKNAKKFLKFIDQS